MNPIAQKYGATQLAGVNLVPRDVAERKKMRSVRATAGLAVLITVGLVVAVFLLALLQRQSAQSDLDSAVEAEAAAVAARDAKKSVYEEMVRRESIEYALMQIGFGDIDQAQLTAAIQGTADSESSFTIIDIAAPTPAGFTTVGDDALYADGVGAVTFSARTVSLAKATELLRRIEAVPGLAGVRGVAEGYTQDGGEVIYTVEGSAVITELWLSGSLVPENNVIGTDQLEIVRAQDGDDATQAPATPEPSPAPSAETEEES